MSKATKPKLIIKQDKTEKIIYIELIWKMVKVSDFAIKPKQNMAKYCKKWLISYFKKRRSSCSIFQIRNLYSKNKNVSINCSTQKIYLGCFNLLVNKKIMVLRSFVKKTKIIQISYFRPFQSTFNLKILNICVGKEARK
jgi:hypothetical protein